MNIVSVFKSLLLEDIKKYIKKEINNSNVEDKIINELIEKHVNNNPFIFINPNKEKEIIKKDKFINKENRCNVRIWNKGYGGQCTMNCSIHSKDIKLCTRHLKLYNEYGYFRFGLITEELPIRDMYNGNKLKWRLI
jgi:hypothetical protein